MKKEKEYMIPNPIDENDVEKLLVEFNVTPYTKNSSVLISATLRAYNNHIFFFIIFNQF